MSDDYQWWRDALAGKKVEFHDGDLRAGFFRMRSKNRQTGAITWTPVAVYRHNGLLQCRIGSNIVSEIDAQERWTYFGRYAVSEEAWREVAEKGGVWPDQDQVVAEQTRGMGDNSPPADPEQELEDQIKAAAEGKSAYLKIADDAKSAQAQSLRSRLLELANKADKIRKDTGKPHYDKYKAINDRWSPLIEMAKGAAAALKSANERYLTAQLQEQRKAEAASADMMEPEVKTVSTQIKSSYGRAASVKAQWAIDKIISYDEIYGYFKNSVAVKELLEKLASRETADGKEVPGVTRKEVVTIK